MEQLKSKNPIVFAWKQTIPVMLGYIFLGIAFGGADDIIH